MTINPQSLSRLAECMDLGEPVHTRQYGSYYVKHNGNLFQPHIDKAQAFEVLEWFKRKGWTFEHSEDYFSVYTGMSVESGIHICMEGKTLQEAIVLAAISLLESEDGVD